jgi:hypothetical protein
LYKSLFDAQIYILEQDNQEDLCKRFSFDKLFNSDFTLNSIEAKHINGHTSGFIIYLYKSCVFRCDYVFFKNKTMNYNSYGDTINTETGANMLYHLLDIRNILCV